MTYTWLRQMSSNIIPSSEADPPPPVHCILPSREVRTPDERRSSLYDTNTCESLLADIDDDSQLNVIECRRTFTQADDFQDLAKDSSLALCPPDSTGLQSENTEESHCAHRHQMLTNRSQILRESGKESSLLEYQASAPSPQSTALSVEVPSAVVVLDASDSLDSCLSPRRDHDNHEFMVTSTSEKLLGVESLSNSLCSGADRARSSCEELDRTDDGLSGNTINLQLGPFDNHTASTSYERANPHVADPPFTVNDDPSGFTYPKSSTLRRMICAQLSVTSYPIGEASMDTTGVTRLEPLFFCGFSAEVDSINSRTALNHLQPRFEDMSRQLTEFWEHLATKSATAVTTTTPKQPYSAPLSGSALLKELQQDHNGSKAPASSNIPQPKHESNQSVVPSFDGVPIYGRWHNEPYYYAGFIRREYEQSGSRHWVSFEDGSKARLRTTDVVIVHLLPTNTQVYVDWDDTDEYRGNCLIIRHTGDCEHPYEIRYEPSGVQKLFRRKNVAVHHSEVCRMRHNGLLPLDTQNDSLIRAAVSGLSLGANSSATVSPVTKAFPPIVSDISLANMVFGKRERKRKTPDDGDTDATVVTNAVHKQSTPRRLDRQINVSIAKRSRLTDRPTYRHIQRHSSSGSRSSRRNRRILVESDEETLTQPMSLECRIKDSSSDEAMNDHSVFRLRRAASSANFYLRRSLSRSLNIPIPSATLFIGWTIVFTGRFHHRETSSSSDDFGADRATLEKLITACGGRLCPSSNLTSIVGKENISPAEHPPWDHVALVATEPCRTLKYVQALATLGRVPLLRTTWILDAIRREHIEEQAAMDSADDTLPQNKHDSHGGDYHNWPLRLLLDRPGRYELPRGYIDSSGGLVCWSTIPILYRCTTPDKFSLPSLFRLPNSWSDTAQDCSIAAILTNDPHVFGPSWSNILKLASGYPLIRGTLDPQTHVSMEDMINPPIQPIPVIPMDDSTMETLSMLADEHYGDKTEMARLSKRFILVDKNGLTVSILSRLRSLPFRWVTCEYFIQSLICGQLLDPQSSPLFTPSFD